MYRHCKKVIFAFIFFLNGRFLFFPLFNYGYTLRLVSLQFSIHPSKGVYWSSRKRQFQFSEASIFWCFEKRTTPKIFAYFAYFPTNWKLELTKGGVIFKYTRRPSWDFFKSSLEELFCRELASACFAEKELHSTRLSEIFQNFKNNMHGKAEGWII